MKQKKVCQLSESLTSLQVPPAPVVEPLASGCQNLLLVKCPAKGQNSSTIDLIIKGLPFRLPSCWTGSRTPIVVPCVYCCHSDNNRRHYVGCWLELGNGAPAQTSRWLQSDQGRRSHKLCWSGSLCISIVALIVALVAVWAASCTLLCVLTSPSSC